jgi:hypothetical protein
MDRLVTAINTVVAFAKAHPKTSIAIGVALVVLSLAKLI